MYYIILIKQDQSISVVDYSRRRVLPLNHGDDESIVFVHIFNFTN